MDCGLTGVTLLGSFECGLFFCWCPFRSRERPPDGAFVLGDCSSESDACFPVLFAWLCMETLASVRYCLQYGQR